MAEVTRIVKTPPVPAKIDYAAVRLTPKEIDYLRTGLEYAYKVNNVYGYASQQIKDLYKSLGHARDGKTTDVANAEAKEASRPSLTMKDFASVRTF